MHRLTSIFVVPAAGAVLGASVFTDIPSIISSHHQLLVTLGAVLGSLLAKLFAQREVRQHAQECPVAVEVRTAISGLSARVAVLESRWPSDR